MAAPVHSSYTVSSRGTTSVVCNKPSGTVSGDLLVAFFYFFDVDQVVTPPAGWTARTVMVGTGSQVSIIKSFDKVAGGSEPSDYTWTVPSAGYLYVSISRITGAHSSPYDTGSSNQGGSSTSTAIGVTTAEAEELLIIASNSYNSGLTTDYSGFTKQFSLDGTIDLHTKAQTSSGATGNFTASRASGDWVNVLLAYKKTGTSWTGSFVRKADGNKARVRMPAGTAASVRLSDGKRL